MDIITITPEQLRGIIAEELAKVQKAQQEQADTKPEHDAMTPREAVRWLAEQGYPIKLSYLYNRMFAGAIPYKKMNRRAIFSKRELAEWMQANTTRPADRRAVVAEELAKRINKRKK